MSCASYPYRVVRLALFLAWAPLEHCAWAYQQPYANEQAARAHPVRIPFELVVDCSDEQAYKRCTLSVVASLPVEPGQRPIVVLFPGFQMPRSWYDSYAMQLASSGAFVVLQYETSSSLVKPVIPDRIEATFIPALLSHVANLSANSSSPFHNRLDLSRVGLLGHSRGAKLAALTLASGLRLRVSPGQSHQHPPPDAAPSSQRSCIGAQGPCSPAAGPIPPSCPNPQSQQQQQQQQHACSQHHMEQQLQQPDPAQALSSSEPKLAALLIDPVDSGRGAQEHDTQYPSAAQALAGKIRSAAIVGAGITGWCNPKDSGWRAFWPVLSSGWLQVIHPAGHLQFTDAEGMWAWLWDKFCGGEAASHAEVEEFPKRAAVAWFGLMLEGKDPAAYVDWSLKQQDAGRASFEVKMHGNEVALEVAR